MGTRRAESIADSSRPNAGRIYDYLLGGGHNFEVDRTAAEGLLRANPTMTLWVRLIRWFLGASMRKLSAEGFTQFIDFASGLPTVDHIHEITPDGTKVLYSDNDPVTVAYAQEIIEDRSNVMYVECDVKTPETLLKSGVPEKLFDTGRELAIGVTGVAWFLTDEELSHALSVLYDWAPEGSKLYFSDMTIDKETTEVGDETIEFYQSVGKPVYPRSRNKLTEALGSWKPEEPGFRPLEEWVDVDSEQVDRARTTTGGDLVGAILTK